ncbi:MAG: FIG004453: protein YceG like, partial [uncultured Solirubrobacteraceae bacterium]
GDARSDDAAAGPHRPLRRRGRTPRSAQARQPPHDPAAAPSAGRGAQARTPAARPDPRDPRPPADRGRGLAGQHDLPAVQGGGGRDDQRHRPDRLDRRRGGGHPRRERHRRLRVRLHAALAARRSQPPGGDVPPEEGLLLRRRDQDARGGPAAAADGQPHDPRGPLAARVEPAPQAGRPEGQLPPGVGEADVGLQAPPLRRAQQPGEPRGLPVPGHVRAPARRHRAPPRGRPARRLPPQHQQGQHAPRPGAQPLDLRGADHRLDGRARGAGGQGAAADLRRHPQPPPGRDAARHRRDDPVRDAQLEPPAEGVRAGDRLALQHAPSRRPAARPDRQPGPRIDQGGGQPGGLRLPLLCGQARHVRRAQLLGDRRRVPGGRQQVQRGARARRRQLAGHLL